MASKIRLAIILAAVSAVSGMAGSLLIHWILGSQVYAQDRPPRTIERIIMAEEFVLADQAGHVLGRFAVDRNGSPNIVLTKDGQEIWSAVPKKLIRPAK
jgi:hypothetical protein